MSGIVVSPMRGWEAGGGVGLGLGVAKGRRNDCFCVANSCNVYLVSHILFYSIPFYLL